MRDFFNGVGLLLNFGVESESELLDNGVCGSESVEFDGAFIVGTLKGLFTALRFAMPRLGRLVGGPSIASYVYFTD